MRYLIPAVLLLSACAANTPNAVREEKPRAVIDMSKPPEDAATCSEKRLLGLSPDESNRIMMRTLPLVGNRDFGVSLIGQNNHGTPYIVDFRRADREATVYVSRGAYLNDEIAEILTGIVRDCATG